MYDVATSRGVNLVTICDHDAIDGALELCALAPNTFVSEEISARFPEDGCVVHAIAVDISEAQHGEKATVTRVSDLEYEPPVQAELRAFVEAISAGAPSPVPGAEGRRAVAVAIAAYRSAEEGRPVELQAISD